MEKGVKLGVYFHDFRIPSSHGKVKWCHFIIGFIVGVCSVFEKNLAIGRFCQHGNEVNLQPTSTILAPA